VEGTHHWRTSLKTRAAVVGVTTLGIALYGLLGGGAKTTVVPFQGKSVSTVAADKYAVATTYGIAAGGESVNTVAIGPNHSLYFYWQIAGIWYGPLQIGGPGTAYSGPAIALEFSTAHLDVAVEGPNHSLLAFWLVGGTWYGPLQVGAPGSTFSAPAVTWDAAGNVDVSAQGPNGSTYYYWSIGGVWHGPLQIAGPGTTLSAPSSEAGFCGSGGTHNCVGVAVKGGSGQSVVYWQQDGTWLAPSISGQDQEFSSPSMATNFPGATAWLTGYQGPGNSLIGQTSGFQGGSNSYCVVAGTGTAYSAPSTKQVGIVDNGGFGTTTSSATFNMGVDGPGSSLYAFWTEFGPPSSPTGVCPTFYGPLQLGGAGTTFSVPAVSNQVTGGNYVVNMFAEGPAHTLWLYWSSAGTWNGPLQVGGPGSTFDSNS
jgi:hypothetical protein